MAKKDKFNSGLPIRKTSELLPNVFQTDINDKFLSATVDPLVQPGRLEKLSGYIGRRYGKTYTSNDVYLDTDQTLRSRYQLEPGVVIKDGHGGIENFYDYIDFKNQLKFFGNLSERDEITCAQEHHSWNPPKQCDRFVNYREYYWVPEGPPPVPVLGQKPSVISEYAVKLAEQSSFIFTPDGYTNNPTLTLYRGQTYRFKVNAPNEGLVIRTNYDTGSLIFNPIKFYVKGEYVVFDNKLWRAKVDVQPLDGSTIDENTQDWEYIENISTGTALDYNKGVINNGITNGFLTFTVPYDAPDILYYQGAITPDRFGRIVIADIESDTFIDVEKEIIGKPQYTSSNGVEFTSGLVVEFRGRVTPEKYSKDSWVVESVGVSITLTRFTDLVVPPLSSNNNPEILFDGGGFDTEPFDDATIYPTVPDYVVIGRDAVDRNPWSRYNRWFHRTVLDYAYKQRGQEFSAPETSRAKRPIIEFLPNNTLFEHGIRCKETVDYLDDFTDDIFSKIEGSKGYNIDGEALFEGARILVTADTDELSNNKIYQVRFIDHNGRIQIHLEETVDTDSQSGDGVLIRRGNKNAGLMFYFDGTRWNRSQQKTSVNQPPRFDVFDADGVSFADPEKYPESSFTGNVILTYKIGNGLTDNIMGFPLSYLNIDNIGDVEFNFEWDTESFTYRQDNELVSKRIATGFYRFNPDQSGGLPLGLFGNCWTKTTLTYIQPILDSVKITEETNSVQVTAIDWNGILSDDEFTIRFYRDGEPYREPWTRNNNTFTFLDKFSVGEIISIRLVCDRDPNTGYYQVPVSLEKNPLNEQLTVWTLGQAVDHLFAALDFNKAYRGVLPGNTNLRDIPIDEFGEPYNTNGTRYMRHSGLAPMSIMLLCDKTVNIIKSIQYAKKNYTIFKNNFIQKAIEIEYTENIPNFVDNIINELTKTKTENSPFSNSDMIGSGAFTTIDYVVEDEGIKTFALSQSFNLEELSERAVYVYINGSQLLNDIDYEFNPAFGFVNIKRDLVLDDIVEIREYLSSGVNFIPSTPTSLGLYKKYKPMKFTDDTYIEPKDVIQGHDGSITLAYGDFRDDLLLELEYRIYNNIKQQYDPNVFDIDIQVSDYYYKGLYSKENFDNIISQEFFKWIQNTNVNYTENEFLDTENSFTYTYSNMTDPTRTQTLPGYWRGVYQWFYDTDRPHRCPWEMLGFSEKPTWWEEEYGPAPYTSGNLILWEDLRDGIIRQGPRAGINSRYKRPSLLDHIPVDGDGNLLSPLDSNLAQDFTLINNKGPFKIGDIGPVEYAWRSSSEYPFAVAIAMCILKPFEFITDTFDRSRTKVNLIGQTVNKDTNLFVTLDDIVVPNTGGDLTAGLVNYLVDYVKSLGKDISIISNKIQNIDVQLATRLSGFVDKEKQRYLLDSKNPRSATSGIFVPQENYDIVFNISSPISSVTYSAVILEKTEGGWTISGYDNINPFFYYYPPLESPNDPGISVGGVSENYIDWEPSRLFNNGVVVKFNEMFYRALKTHTSGENFDESLWKKLPQLPTVGSVTALRRRNFNRLSLEKVSYGTKLTSIQKVVDVLLGYQEFLKSQGFIFDRYDPELGASQDWLTSCKEFMFWTKQNWAIGSLISLSPGAEKLYIEGPIGVADNILDGFYDYQIYKADTKPLSSKFLNVNRQFRSISIETTDTNEGIYFLKLFYVLKEHVTVFDDRTVFNDVIYDKVTGYRQERIKSQGYRTVDWDGDYTSPGFLFDNVNIEVWQPFTDYRLGDIVAYRSYYWTSLSNQLGTEEFDETFWTRLDSTPEKRLVANFDFRINQFEDYYDVTSGGLSETEQTLARHALGYQARSYLENLAEDPVTQFQIYQGFIREKGTNNSITKVFDKLSRSGSSSVNLKEEWAFRVGRFGGLDQLSEIEFNIEKDNFVINPQPILIADLIPSSVTDQYYRLNESNFTIKPLPFNSSINPKNYDAEPTRVSGFVKAEQVDFIVHNRDAILDLNIEEFNENDHVWVTFDNNYNWTVLRFNESSILYIISVLKINDSVVINLSRKPEIGVGEIIGIRRVSNLTGFYKVTEVNNYSVIIEVDPSIQDPEIDISSRAYVCTFTTARFENYQNLDVEQSALLANGAKLWVSENNNQQWEVVEKQKQYVSKSILSYGTTDPVRSGIKVAYDDLHKLTLSSIPRSGYVMSYLETTTGLSLKQIIAPQTGFESAVLNSFGMEIAFSPDYRFLIIGSPLASGTVSHYRGDFDTNASYAIDDIVLHDGKLWKCTNAVFGDGSTISIYSQDWEPAPIIQAFENGRGIGLFEQGLISIYEYVNQQWIVQYSFVSPRPAPGERFGSSIAIGKDANEYYMAVSAPGSLDNRGRVYLFKYDGTDWSYLENPRYRGIFNPAGVYNEGDIVWYDKNLWQCLADSTVGEDSTITVESNDWLRIDSISTQSSLPTNIALDDDGSTLALGLLSDDQIAEMNKSGDQFGTSLTMSRDGSILVVGAPNCDGQFFANYRGIWRSDIEYLEDDIVKYQDPNAPGADLNDSSKYLYYKLVDNQFGPDSTIRSYNEDPSDSEVWQEVGDSTTEPSGKIFIYQRNINGVYEFKQSISAGSLNLYSDLESGYVINQGDQFGFALDIDYSGTTLVVTSPRADINYQNQGSAYVFQTDGLANIQFRLQQILESYEKYPNEYFGQSIKITPGAEKIVIGAKDSTFKNITRFDTSLGSTVYDEGKTKFVEEQGFAGAVYLYQNKGGKYLLTEKLDTTLSPYESFGYSIDITYDVVVVGSPDYRAPTPHGPTIEYGDIKTGITRLFKKDSNKDSWNIISIEEPTVDIEQIKSIAIYDNINNIKIKDLDYVDHAKLKILNQAEQEISFKTIYDPAVYSLGNDTVNVIPDVAWTEKNVGKLWWNISTAKWIYYEQDDTAFRLGHWNELAEGASIDVYEWVESPLLPSEWAALADTNDGLSQGISGQPLYPNDDVYSVKVLYNPNTGLATSTLYYYWVKNSTVIPTTVGRNLSASSVSNLILNPAGSGESFIALIDDDKFLAYNFDTILNVDQASINIQYKKNKKQLNQIHNEYQLLTEGVANSLPCDKLEQKWLDSLIGQDTSGNRVPDADLPPKQRYGVEYRPRQSMFVDRITALKQAVIYINNVLNKEAFTDIINFDNLNLVDSEPSLVLNLYDLAVDSYIDLETVGVSRVRQGELSVNLVDGLVDTIDIVDPGFGYKVAPPVEFEGDGIGAKAVTTIDNQGRIISVTVTNKGRKYSSCIAKVRRFSVLVRSDSTSNNFWSIYAWDNSRLNFYRSASQAYDTRRYWNYSDWWKQGYSPSSRIVKEISMLVQESSTDLELGDLLRISEYASGGWAVFEKISNTALNFNEKYLMVGRQNGTVQLSEDLYHITSVGIGFDNNKSFDTTLYDIENALELRNILKAVKEDIFIGEYSVEWNNLFFSGIRYVFSEQQYVDWAFKTSFLNAIHDVGELIQKVNYRNDNLENFQDYINEVKPYRTTVREYISRYTKIENNNAATTDFDLPSVYSSEEGKIIPVDTNNVNINSYPWKWWYDNRGYSIVSIEVADSGENYSQVPKVVIEGNGTGAEAIAYISNGVVSGIRILNGGVGYTTSPSVSLVGGNPASSRTAKAVAIIGDTKARTFDMTVKFDRINKEGTYQTFSQLQTFTATGYSAAFDLSYAPTRDKTKISVTRNDQILLPDEYSVSLYYSSSDLYKILRGKLILSTVPELGDIVIVNYEKNDALLDSVNRIQKYYSPSSGMKGDELNQLMTGIDFGGVQIQGTTFEVTGGWDALPWFTDNWDSVESSSDYYVIVDGSTTTIELPYTPVDGQEINIYIKRVGTDRTIRVDDPAYLNQVDSSTSSNPNAEMPTFFGDGSTRVIDIWPYLSTNAGDTLIFRPNNSDGSVTINDNNILDTAISGGSLSSMSGAYVTATGLNAEDISIDGGKFITPDQIPAPEENVPGQVLDSVSIKVFNSTQTGAAPLQSRTVVSDGSTTLYSIGLQIVEKNSLLVYVDKVKQTVDTDYTIDLTNLQIQFTSAPNADSIIEIIAIGIGGVDLLDYQEFIADGETTLFLTSANYVETTSVFVTVDGIQRDVGYRESGDLTDTINKTLIQFGTAPSNNSVIKIICLSSTVDFDSTGLSIIRINQQEFVYDGSTRKLEPDSFVNLSRASAQSSIIVEVNDVALQGPDTIFFEYDGITNTFILGQDPEEPIGAILSSNITVLINNEVATPVQDYVYDGTTKELTITKLLTRGDIIKIENNLRTQYNIVNNDIIIESSVLLNENDVIKLTWFSEYPSLQILSDEYKGGKVNYKLEQTPINASYVWVYKNGIKLTQEKDFHVSLPRSVLYLNEDSNENDSIKIITFGNKIFRLPSAYEIHKDMLNVYRYKRYSRKEIRLAKELNYYDTEILVNDGTELGEPILSRNIPGIIEINNEKIAYMVKTGNVLSQLRRGIQGTAIAEKHVIDSRVIDTGAEETIPYNETQEREDFVSDGSTLLIGPLEFIPTQGTRNTTWFRSTIPNNYGACDTIEIFAGGKRLRKDPIEIYDETLGSTSPSADRNIEAEFSVDGINSYVRLTEPLPVGTRISVIRKQGRSWYDRGETTATGGVTLLENSTAIAKFIADSSTELPE